jgi:NAD+ kinase
MITRVGILAHPHRPGAGPVGEHIADWLRQRGLNAWLRTAWVAEEIAPLVRDLDLVIAIGGDGAMLRAARFCSAADVPVFGINTGHLGFLTEIGGDDWEPALVSLLAGQFWVEQRMMISAELWRDGTVQSCNDALNDVVISRGAVARSILLETYIDTGWATTYYADGVIIATPTGSTAYALAVGGPILPPELKNILVVPVAPHLSMDRPMVLSEGAVIEVVVSPDTQADVILTVDGEMTGLLESGDSVIVRASERLSRFIRLRGRNYFYRSLLDRMEPRVPARREPGPRTVRSRRGHEQGAG